MLIKRPILMSLLLGISSSFATTYKPISVSEHIQQSNAIVIGNVIQQNSELFKDSMIVTKVEIKLEKWLGLDGEDQDRYIEITIPGGQVGDDISKIPGNINFKDGEKVLVFLTERDGQLWPSNLGLSKYSIKRIGDGELLVNQVFPTHPQIGQLPIDFVINKASTMKASKFITAFKDKYELDNYKNEIRTNDRRIASLKIEEKNEENKVSMMWLMLTLGLIGGLMISYRKHQE